MAKETKEVVQFLLAIGEAAGKALEDEDIGLSDAVFLFDSFRKIGPAIDNAAAVPGELAAWTETDTQEMVAAAMGFDIPQDNIEALVKDALQVAGPFIEFIAKLRHPA